MVRLDEEGLKIEVEGQASELLFDYQQALIASLSGAELNADQRFYLADLLRELSLSEVQLNKAVKPLAVA